MSFLQSDIVVSVVEKLSRRQQIEVGFIAREGMTGVNVVLGDSRSPRATYIQSAGTGMCIEAVKLLLLENQLAVSGTSAIAA
jgi:hypothetical protein